MQLVPCDYGKRALAYIIDVLFMLIPSFIGVFVGFALLFSDTVRSLGVITVVAGLLWLLGAGIWNEIIRQGKTGQTVGKSRQKIQLVNIKTGATPGIGIVFVRVIVAYLFNAITGGLFMIVDLLFPAFDKRKQRIVDKICSTMVVDTVQTTSTAISSSGTSWSAPTSGTLGDPLN
jgi:uncharacterized RDD family membrane protein YckC